MATISSSPTAAVAVNTTLTTRIFGVVDTATNSEMNELCEEIFTWLDGHGGGYHIISGEALRGGIMRFTVVAWVPVYSERLLDEIAVPA